MHTSDLP
jgi:hypothetical protein